MIPLENKQIWTKYTGTAEKKLLTRVVDQAEKVLKNHQPVLTDFYDPYHCELIFTVIKGIVGLKTVADGGYAEAERCRVLIFPEYMLPEQLDFKLTFLVVTGKFKMSPVNHRDYLGSLIGLGLKRAKLGDVIVSDQGAQIVVDTGVAQYIVAHLTKVGRVGVAVQEITREQLALPSPKIKIINTVVASMRLDAVSAAGYGTSRSKLVREINAGRLNLNWCLCNNPSALVQEGDMLSLRGRGRVKVAEIKGNTKKGRVSLVLHKYE